MNKKLIIADATQQMQSWGDFENIADAMARFPTINIYLAGGVLRNIFSKIDYTSKDFDFFINGPDVDKFLEYLALKGRLSYGPFGSARWYGKKNTHIYSDIVHIDKFNNGLWKCEDIKDVLNQFDFTANAIALNLRTFEIINPQNGIRDAERRILRAIRFDYPEESISEKILLSRNSILWFRLNHYATAFGFKLENVTLSWLRKNSHFIKDLEYFESIFFKPMIDVTRYHYE